MAKNDSKRPERKPERKEAETPRGPAGDARPSAHAPDPRTGGGQDQEKVEDRPGVGTVKPEDYPPDERASGDKS